MELDAWIAAQIPDRVPALMAPKRAQIGDPPVVDAYFDLGDAADWTPTIRASRHPPTVSSHD